MNRGVNISQIKHDASRLLGFLELWEQDQEVFSKPFLANGILERTEMLRRHLISPEPDMPPSEIHGYGKLLERAMQRIQADPSIAQTSLEVLSTEHLERKIKRFSIEYQDGVYSDDEVPDIAFDLIDIYFSFDSIVATLEQIDLPRALVTRLKRLSEKVLMCRAELMDIAGFCRPFSAEIESYAMYAPGGPGLPPWEDLLSACEDPLLEVLISEQSLHRTPAQALPIDLEATLAGKMPLVPFNTYLITALAASIEGDKKDQAIDEILSESVIVLDETETRTLWVMQKPEGLCIGLTGPGLSSSISIGLKTGRYTIEPAGHDVKANEIRYIYKVPESVLKKIFTVSVSDQPRKKHRFILKIKNDIE